MQCAEGDIALFIVVRKVLDRVASFFRQVERLVEEERNADHMQVGLQKGQYQFQEVISVDNEDTAKVGQSAQSWQHGGMRNNVSGTVFQRHFADILKQVGS